VSRPFLQGRRGAGMTKVTDCIVEQRLNIGVGDAEKKVKRLIKDTKFVGNVPAEVITQLGFMRKSMKDSEKLASVRE
jgi:hypothetical protein